MFNKNSFNDFSNWKENHKFLSINGDVETRHKLYVSTLTLMCYLLYHLEMTRGIILIECLKVSSFVPNLEHLIDTQQKTLNSNSNALWMQLRLFSFVLLAIVLLSTLNLSLSKSIQSIFQRKSIVISRNNYKPILIAEFSLVANSTQTYPKSIMALPSSPSKYNCSPLVRNALGIWGVLQVLSILGNALKRLIPVALQPIIQNDLHPYQWALGGAWCLYMAYAEGYKAFHLKFSPQVVSRAFHIAERPNVFNVILAGPYSMGLFGASKKRMIVSWAISLGVTGLIAVVKKLPYPYRGIIDAGVVVGLTLGSLSIILKFVQALFGNIPKDDDDKKEQ